MLESRGLEHHLSRAVDFLCHGGDFVCDGIPVGVRISYCGGGQFAFAGNRFGERYCALAAFCKAFAKHGFRSAFAAEIAESVEFRVGIACKTVYRHNNALRERFQIVQVTFYVGKTFFKGGDVFGRCVLFGHAAVEFEAAHGHHEYHAGRREPRLSAFDIQEFLAAEFGAETRFGDDVIGVGEGGHCRHNAVAAVRYVRKRAAVNVGGRTLESLDEVGFGSVAEQYRHCVLASYIARRHFGAVLGVSHNYVAEPFFEVGKVLRHT